MSNFFYSTYIFMKGVGFMKKSLKLEHELLFKNNIKEITSISLDSDYKVENNKLVGNFLIEGDYKIHEVSINKEKFDFKIPFNVELDTDVDVETVKLEINNFIYDYKKDELLVNIEYDVNYDKKDIIVFEDKDSLDDFLLNLEVEVIDDVKEQEKVVSKEVEFLEEEKIENKENIRNIEDIKPDDVIKKIDKQKDKYISYQIYKIKENDTLESIVLKYKTTIDELKEYNDLSSLNINDKIIIPCYE